MQRRPLLALANRHLKNTHYFASSGETAPLTYLFFKRRAKSPLSDCSGIAGSDAVKHSGRQSALDRSSGDQPKHCKMCKSEYCALFVRMLI